MNILVCIKQVPNTKNVTIDPKTHRLVRHGIASILNPADRIVLEKALQLRERYGGSITVISMGAPHAGEVLLSAHLVGADRCILLTDKAFGGSDTFATASVLAAAAKYEENRTGEAFDLILCGAATVDGETGQVGPELAELMGCSYFAGISQVVYTGASLKIDYALDDLTLSVDAKFPVLLTYPLTGDVFLRSAIHDRMETVKEYVLPQLGLEELSPWLNAGEIGLHGSATKVVRSYVPTTERKGIRIAGGSVADRVDRLLGYLRADGLLDGNGKSASIPTATVSAGTATNGKICVFIEQDRNGSCKNIGLELLTPAMRIGSEANLSACAVVIGTDNKKAISELKQYGIDEIISCEDSCFADCQVSTYADAFYTINEAFQPEGILFGGTAMGKELAARLAAKCHTGLTAECTAISYDEERKSIIWSRPAYGGNLMADIVCQSKRPQMGTVREGVFVKPAKAVCDPAVHSVTLPDGQCDHSVTVLSKAYAPMPVHKSTEKASIMVSMGRGVRDLDGFDMICDFADAIGAELGASRGGVEMRMISGQYLVGSNGRSVRPDLYIACGISGAMQHMAGVKDAGCVVAINSDPNAEIFRLADYGIVGDLFDVVPVLQERMEAEG